MKGLFLIPAALWPYFSNLTENRFILSVWIHG